MAAGAAAGATSLAVVYPLDFARTRLAADVGVGKGREFTGIIDCLRKCSASDGIQGLYRGYTVSIGGIVFYRMMYFGLFDTGKVLLFEDMKRANILTVWSFAQFVTISAGTATYPLDTVRRRLMMTTG